MSRDVILYNIAGLHLNFELLSFTVHYSDSNDDDDNFMLYACVLYTVSQKCTNFETV